MEPLPDTVNEDKIKGSRGKTTAIILLNKHSSKTMTKDILLYPQVRELFSFHQRSLFLQQMLINTETHTRQCTQSERLEHKTINEYFCHKPPPKSQKSMWKRKQPNCEEQDVVDNFKETSVSKRNMAETNMTAETMRTCKNTCISLNQKIKVVEERKEHKHQVPAVTKRLVAMKSLQKGKTQFSSMT